MKNKTTTATNVVFGILSAVLLNTVNTSSVEAMEAEEINPASETLCRKFPLNSRCKSSSLQASSVELNYGVKKVEAGAGNELLCRKFPLNSLCQGLPMAESQTTLHTLDRQSFCSRFPLNSKCQESVLQTFRLNLNSSGEEDEWVRIEQQDDRVTLLHTTQVREGLISEVLNGGLELIPIPIPLPLPELNKYSWDDHSTIQVAYKSDRCESKKCVISAKNTLMLPKGDDVHGGEFTIRYREEGLKRSVSFRVPEETKAEIEETITVGFID